MIPYEDLVVALRAWRVKQGLPVGELSASLVPPTPQNRPTSTMPRPRSTPPSPPPRGGSAAPPDEAVDDATMLEDDAQYDSQGANYAISFEVEQDGEATKVGGPPRTTDSLLPPDPTGQTAIERVPGAIRRQDRKRDDDW
jgi:hypothetical protein